MIAIDTNVLVRFLVNDEPEQAEAARKLFANFSIEQPGFICREVALELSWVLDRAYGFSRSEIASVLEQLVASAEFYVESADDVLRSAAGYRSGGAEFSDRMIVAASGRSGAKVFFTFDLKAARLSDAELLSENYGRLIDRAAKAD